MSEILKASTVNAKLCSELKKIIPAVDYNIQTGNLIANLCLSNIKSQQ